MHGLAANYGWTEAQIFSVPWVRAKEYCVEIRIDCDIKVSRDLPEVGEEVKYHEMLKANIEAEINGGQKT